MNKKNHSPILKLVFGSFVLFFTIGLMAQNGSKLNSSMSSSSSKPIPVTKDTQIDDPLLEEQLNEDIEQNELEKEADQAQGKELIIESTQQNQAEPPKELQSNKQNELSPQTTKSQEAESLNSSPTAEVAPPLFKNNTSNSRSKTVDDSTTSKSHRRWNPRDPNKGFLMASEDDDAYYYKEESSDSAEKEYKDDTNIKPKKSTYKKGLMFVSTDGSYVYKMDESPLEGSASIRFTQMPALPMTRTIGGHQVTYSDIYGESPVTLTLIDYDWLAFRNFGHWVLSFGTSIGSKTGQGRFVDDASIAFEKYTLWIFLNHLSFVYRFQYTPHPWFVPYISAGFVPAMFYESRDDNKRNKTKFVPAAQGSGGIRFNIGMLDEYGAGSLDSEYGINNFWLDIEYRRIQSAGSDLDISSNLINVGVGFDL